MVTKIGSRVQTYQGSTLTRMDVSKLALAGCSGCRTDNDSKQTTVEESLS